MSVIDLDKPEIQKADDAIVRVVRSCVCGSDLWAYSAGDSKQSTRSTTDTKQSASWKKSEKA